MLNNEKKHYHFQYNSKFIGGFTLIEILVGLTIIGLIFGIGYANFRDFTRRQALEAAARALTGSIRSAQEMAISGNKPDGCGQLIGYKYEINETSYSIWAYCSNAEGVTGKFSVGKDNVKLPVEVTMTSSQPSFLFKVLGEGTDITQGDVTINLEQINIGKTVTVTVTQSGEIK